MSIWWKAATSLILVMKSYFGPRLIATEFSQSVWHVWASLRLGRGTPCPPFPFILRCGLSKLPSLAWVHYAALQSLNLNPSCLSPLSSWDERVEAPGWDENNCRSRVLQDLHVPSKYIAQLWWTVASAVSKLSFLLYKQKIWVSSTDETVLEIFSFWQSQRARKQTKGGSSHLHNMCTCESVGLVRTCLRMLCPLSVRHRTDTQSCELALWDCILRWLELGSRKEASVHYSASLEAWSPKTNLCKANYN